uniref:Mega-hemocyanin n=1 Tax=Melanoides tuberculata TaxID=55729 RepID=V5KPU0_MELTU|nr:mega-hemocyanin [Melanoides tuberculata]
MVTSPRFALALLAFCVQVAFTTGSLIRKNVENLSSQEILSLQTSLRALAADESASGFKAVAAYHGEPSMCEDNDGVAIACCLHGMAVFPQWHRLYVVQFEQLLVNKGLNIGVPYWDTLEPLTHLPSLVEEQIFRDPNGGVGGKNSWFSGEVPVDGAIKNTARAVDDRLFEKVAPGKNTQLFNIILDALEQDDYCQFEVQLEVAHNHIHYLVGGRHQYSMATLEYSSYDPIFFLHHSNIDRIFVIWQELQKKRGKPYDHSDCSVEQFRWNLKPFDRDTNPIALTKQFHTAKELFSNLQLGYVYDDLTLNGMDVDQLYNLMEQRRARERAFGVFSLHGLGFSANARVKVCSDLTGRRKRTIGSADLDVEHHCEFAGDFFLLGGANEMPWEFHLPFYFDVSDAVQRLGLSLTSKWSLEWDLYHVNGTALPGNLLPTPYGKHRPAKGDRDSEEVSFFADRDVHRHAVVRKNVVDLTDEEVYELRLAMDRFQNDTSVDGYQAIAEFHGLPARCPRPDAAVRYACCIHGMATFPHWHRLFVVQIEDELKARDLHFGMPYWDWTVPNAQIPAIAAEATYQDPHHPDVTLHNPFYDAAVAFLNTRTTRDVQNDLAENPIYGDHSKLYDGILLAFEQTDFCDFEIQFEVIHNSPHFLVGGFGAYTLATLHYSAFDPIFYLHHSNVDRMWAIWQELQIRRGLPYRAHCAHTMTHEPMKPFSFAAPLNNNEKTFSHSEPSQVYDYERDLGYTYDSLTFGGMTIEQLENYLEERQSKERVFVGIELHNIGASAWVKVLIDSGSGGEPYLVGKIAVLGGEKEMPWHFDRLFKMEITDALSDLGLSYDDNFDVTLQITDVTGKEWSSDSFQHDTIFHEPGKTFEVRGVSDKRTRLDVDHLNSEQIQNLRDAFKALEDDTSINGFNQIAAFHGQPSWCPSPDAETKYACCLHGMPTFPHWHRLITVQLENALRDKGFESGLPYWDWTLPMTELPESFTAETYDNPVSGANEANPLHHAVVEGHKTTRSVRGELFQQPAFGKFTRIGEQVMLAFEQTDYCSFEVQFEVAHNYIHALVGGNELYSMASLRYTAYDPLFALHHSNTDRIWAIWQALQKYRGLPYNTANCAITQLRKPLQPFAQTSTVNPDSVTRDHSVPFDVFDYSSSFHYDYDNLEFNGLSIAQLQHEVVVRKAHERVFAGFMLHGIKQSALVRFEICSSGGACGQAGEFYILGDDYEMPWEYDRLFKYEITDQLKEQGLEPLDRYDIKYTVFALDGSVVGTDTFGQVTVVHTYGAGHVERKSYGEELKASSHVRRNVDDLTGGEIESLKAALQKMEDDGSFENIAEFHGAPGLCELNGKKVGCCVHGMATFPHWHRLYVEQVENALLSHGSAVSIPYWDWTKPITKLPDIIAQETYFDSRSQTMQNNPFFRGPIRTPDVNDYTTRDPQPELFNNDYFLQQTLLALEQTSYCDFEAQFEVTHNAFHSFLGGRGKYSLSTLDYSAFDPVFFLYHANTDRIFAIWQALQSYRGLHWDEADCALNHMRDGLHPFDVKAQNEFDITHKYSRPVDVWDYSDHLQYHYDNLLLNDWTIPQLEEVLKTQRSRDRMFAGFLLHNIGTSADVELHICVATGNGDRNCNNPAGKFSILGGEYEMPFTFDRLYKYDISDSIRKLGLKLDSGANFDLKVQIHAYNGSYLDPSLLKEPTIIFEPGENTFQTQDGKTQRNMIRRNVLTLSLAERRSLVLAMRRLQEDHSADGFQALASFHALPELCPYPEAAKRYACCVHGMASFPQWHRLYTVQFEEALRRHGSLVGIPYWDTSRPQKALPAFATDEKFTDPVLNVEFDNPWLGADIEFENSHTEREPNLARLGEEGEHGYDTWLYEQYLLALEQDNYCDFEVQFEIAHNAIHAWVGGSKIHSMGHLHYASYDPIFLLHHSSTDRIFAVWQELQRLRGKDPNEANCALEIMHEPLKPFSFGSPYNLNENTQRYSRPEDIFDYQSHFHYEYDSLEVLGMSPAQLEDAIHKRQEKDRVFAGFLLKGIGTSAHVEFTICNEAGVCTTAGDFDILGGSAEMPWSFDRAYKYDITNVLEKKGLEATDAFKVKVAITAQDGTALDSSLLPEPSIILQHATRDQGQYELAPNRVRRSLSDLTERDVMSLKSALHDLQEDDSATGWQSLAAYHGVPALCPSPEEAKYACCIHGMPTFPHWHRLYVLAVEHSLIKHGSSVAIPYWDWTNPLDKLPELFTKQTYYDAWRDEVYDNPFARGYVKGDEAYTVRDPQPELKERSRDGKHSVLFDQVLLALEQTDYCDFEVQYEVTHNAIHYLVGGPQTFSLSSLHYSSYDPIFFVHHSFVDKIWAVWQALQRKRGKPSERADCAVNYMYDDMHPFDSAKLDPDPTIRSHANPSTVFNIYDLGYKYDDYQIGGKNLDELEALIKDNQAHPRVFAGFHLKGIGSSADVVFKICKDKSGGQCTRAGSIFILGGEKEMPWEFDRLYKYDITDALKDNGIQPEDVFDAEAPFYLKYEVTAVNGSTLPKSVINAPTLIFVPATGASVDAKSYAVAGMSVRKDINTLSSAETQSLKNSLQKVMDGEGPLSYQKIAEMHGWPGDCEQNGKKVACCHHGMASFPQWHRVYTRLLEMAMTWQGANVGIPYWDWTEAFTALPSLVTDDGDNPFNHGHIEALGKVTSREPRPQLFKDPEHGEESFFYRQILLAFEQRDYCDFEVQFEVTHNAPHSWIGGTSPYGMSTLEFSSYDPVFFLHHSNVDRQFAIWQALQKYRGLDYNSANCDIQELRMDLEPFNRDYIPIVIIRNNARAIDAFNYDQYSYQYDNLNFHGMSIPELEALLEKRRSEDHVFLNFMLLGIGASADVTFDICDSEGHCNFAGTFAVLGGPLEMPWSFDRLFKYDVTSVFRQMHLRPDSDYSVKVHIVSVNGTELDSDLLEAPSVSFVPGKRGRKAREDYRPTVSEDLIRKEVSSLSLEEVSNLKNALYKLQNDHGPNGFEAIASFHGDPGLCPEGSGSKYACCQHGMPVFPHWHRLLTVQFERALKAKGSVVGVPYWDWTRPSRGIPQLFSNTYGNNPFLTYEIQAASAFVERDVQVDALEHTTGHEGFEDSLFHQALETLEETSYCEFEVQFEMLHNAVHALVGGTKTHSMATLEWSAFDPFFMVHHSSIDRIWRIWQELQRLRKKPFNVARCAMRYLRKPLEPFSYASVNTDEVARTNSRPIDIFDTAKFHYDFDNLDLGGHSIGEVNKMINDMRSKTRLFVGFVLSGIETSATVKIEMDDSQGNSHEVGTFYVLGGHNEMPWAYERVYKYEITEAAKKYGLDHDSVFNFHHKVVKYDGQELSAQFKAPILVERPAGVDYDVAIFQLKKDNDLAPKVVLPRGTRIRFHSAEDGVSSVLREMGSYTNAVYCSIPPGDANTYKLEVEYTLEPGDYFFVSNDEEKCKQGDRIQISIDEE